MEQMNDTLEGSFIKTPEELKVSIASLKNELEGIEKDPNLTAEAADLKRIITNLELRISDIQN